LVVAVITGVVVFTGVIVITGVASALVFIGNLEQNDVEHLVGSIINRTADEYRLSIGDVTVTYDIQQCETSIG
jgi:hypothetical protein